LEVVSNRHHLKLVSSEYGLSKVIFKAVSVCPRSTFNWLNAAFRYLKRQISKTKT